MSCICGIIKKWTNPFVRYTDNHYNSDNNNDDEFYGPNDEDDWLILHSFQFIYRMHHHQTADTFIQHIGSKRRYKHYLYSCMSPPIHCELRSAIHKLMNTENCFQLQSFGKEYVHIPETNTVYYIDPKQELVFQEEYNYDAFCSFGIQMCIMCDDSSIDVIYSQCSGVHESDITAFMRDIFKHHPQLHNATIRYEQSYHL